MSGHTPKLTVDKSGLRVVSGGVSRATIWVAPVDEKRLSGESWLDMRERTQPCRERAEAEARQFALQCAAAPEMYEALELALQLRACIAEAMTSGYDDRPSEASAWFEVDAIERGIRAALAKADGRPE